MIEVKDQTIFIKEEITCKEALLERVSNSTRDSFIDFSSHPGARQMCPNSSGFSTLSVIWVYVGYLNNLLYSEMFFARVPRVSPLTKNYPFHALSWFDSTCSLHN